MAERLALGGLFTYLVKDALACAKARGERYGTKQLTPYEKYTRKDACRLLNWSSDESSTIYGYKTKHQTCPIFVTYHKNDEVESSVAYGDEFLNEQILRWYTRSKRTLASKEVVDIIDADNKDIDIHLFVKKDDDEGTDFYYLGQAHPDTETVKQEEMKNAEGKVIPVVTMNMVLEQPMEKSIYRYLVDDTKEKRQDKLTILSICFSFKISSQVRQFQLHP